MTALAVEKILLNSGFETTHKVEYDEAIGDVYKYTSSKAKAIKIQTICNSVEVYTDTVVLNKKEIGVYLTDVHSFGLLKEIKELEVCELD